AGRETFRTLRLLQTLRVVHRRKIFLVSVRPQEIHDPSTGFPQLTTLPRRTTLETSMRRRTLMVAILSIALFAPLERASGEDDATLLRVFLRDGTSLVSYGEPARVGSRVVFSMPTTATPNPPLHLVNLAIDRVDWERTERYATAA